MIQLDQQYWKSKMVYPRTFGRIQSEEINNGAQHFVERFREVPLQGIIYQQNMEVAEKQARITFCNLISDQIEQKPAFLYNIWFSDETCFHNYVGIGE